MKMNDFLKTKEKKVYKRIGIVVVLAAGMLIIGGMQQICLGQNYFEIIVDNKVVAKTAADLEADELMRECRKELTEMTGGFVCLDADVEVRTAHKLFTHLVLKDVAESAVLDELAHKQFTDGMLAYTVSINNFKASFASLDEVDEFLSMVKAAYDENNQFSVAYETDDDKREDTFSAKLERDDSGRTFPFWDSEVSESPKGVCAGSMKTIADVLAYAFAHPGEKNYQTGLVDLGFVQHVSIYTDYVKPSGIWTVAGAVAEVTKEKETNKIYEVEEGDCLSVIAEENDTTVKEIMELNGLSDASAYIGIGDELIISVPRPDLSIWKTEGIVYEEDYTADPTIIGNDFWYTTTQTVRKEGTGGHREVNAFVTYEDGVETERTIAHQTILTAAIPAVIEQGTKIPPTYMKPIYGGRFTSGFGKRWGRMHKGVDWACPVGTNVLASSEGVVEYADWSSGYGYNVIIDHPDGRKTRYCHLSKTLVTAGDHVVQGQQIALSGNTGHSTGPHVHFEIFINGTQVNPLEHIN